MLRRWFHIGFSGTFTLFCLAVAGNSFLAIRKQASASPAANGMAACFAFLGVVGLLFFIRALRRDPPA